MGFNIGDGSRIYFWSQEWIHVVILKFRFSRTYALAVNKEGKVREFGHFVNGVWRWKIVVRRPLFNWELDQWSRLMVIINKCKVTDALRDRLGVNLTLVFYMSRVMENLDVVVQLLGFTMGGDKDPWSFFLDWHNTLWCTRNEIVFSKKKFQIDQIVDIIKLRIVSWVKAKWPDVQVCWEAGTSWVGGVLRDSLGGVLMKFSKHIGIAKSNYAEIVAICEALKLFIASPWASCKILVLESDSMNAVKWVCDPKDVP
ncbi:hypothetical protein PTKIN_Ptkin01aG0295900 [Pterospermum kingtungense]